MVITWDDTKRLANRAKHGLDFASLDIDFFLDAAILPAKQGRFCAFGRLDGKVITVVFARVGSEALAIVSMRAASRKERSFYVP